MSLGSGNNLKNIKNIINERVNNIDIPKDVNIHIKKIKMLNNELQKNNNPITASEQISKIQDLEKKIQRETTNQIFTSDILSADAVKGQFNNLPYSEKKGAMDAFQNEQIRLSKEIRDPNMPQVTSINNANVQITPELQETILDKKLGLMVGGTLFAGLSSYKIILVMLILLIIYLMYILVSCRNQNNSKYVIPCNSNPY